MKGDFSILNLVVYFYLRASEIWSDKRGAVWLEWPYKRGLLYYLIMLCLLYDLYQYFLWNDLCYTIYITQTDSMVLWLFCLLRGWKVVGQTKEHNTVFAASPLCKQH